MDFASSFRATGQNAFAAHQSPQTMFKALRRLHGQNLESRGLNDMSEAFQSFVTRARFFSVGKLRRTWSHSAAEFIKYRRLLPMLLADGQQFNTAETDDFDASLASYAKAKEERKVIVTNVSPRVTPSQLQSFFSKFGKVSHCSLPREDRRLSMFGTLPKNLKNCGTATLTFKRPEDAEKAKNAAPEELKFYEQFMVVTPFVSRRKGGKGVILTDDSQDDTFNLSRASSNQSLASTTMSLSTFEGRSMDDIATSALERIAAYLPVNDTIRMERVSKRCMEASMKSWSLVPKLVLVRDCEGFGKSKPFRNNHLKSIMRRAGVHLKSLDLSGIVHLMDEKALEIIATSCPSLEELDLSGVRASWEALGDLGESLTNLKRLTYRDMDSASDKAFWFLIKGCGRGLHFIDLRGCRRLHGRCFRLFGDRLEQLYLDGCVHVDERAIEDLCTCAAGLKELRLNDCYQITDENLSMISRTMSDLRVFTLCGDRFEKLTSAGLAHISNMTSLTELALDYNPLVDDMFLISICEELKNLKTLSLANAGTDQTLTAKGLAAIAQLKSLEQLDLSSLAALRSGVLLEIVFACRSISLLQLRNCVYLSDDGIKGLTRMKNLRHLDLSGSILITNDSIQEFIKAFPQVKGEKGSVTIVIGGTAADSSRLSMRGSRVVVDLSDYTSILSMSHRHSHSFSIGTLSDDELSDNDFENLTSQRSFYIDAICGEEDSPIEDEAELQRWAEREARNLGLIDK
uniref:RRM domain-containing protein n=1 Tax=Haemonchus contortus TaxID=6289 RepID=A0A7I5E798_HAECO|nr:RNA recognition motif domain containing protein [Haemonchus contortus]